MVVELNPTIIIGLGGQGTSLVNRIKKRSYENYRIIRNRIQLPLVQFLVIDSEFQSFTSKEDVILTPNEMQELSVDPQDIYSIIKDPSKLRGFEDYENCFIEREVSDILEVRGAGCGGWPIICKTNGIYRINTLYSALSSLMKNATDTEKIMTELYSGGFSNEFRLSTDPTVQVLIFASLGGGTGRGLYELVISLIRLLGQKYVSSDVEKVKIRLINIMPSVLKRTISEIPDYVSPNTYTAFREIEHFIKNGYQFDNIYRNRLEELGINISENETVRFADFVYLASIYNAGNGYAITSDYESYKDLLAEYFSDAIFKGFLNQLIAWESNISSERASKGNIVELETGRKDRSLNYGRFAYFKIVYPTDLLLDFIKNHTIKELVEDLIEGQTGTNKQRIDEFKKTLFRFEISLSNINYENPTIGYSTYDDNWTGAINNIFNQHSNMYDQIVRNEYSIDANVRGHLNSIINYLSQNLKDDGLRGIKQYLESGEESLIGKINKLLGKDHISNIRKKKDIEKEIKKAKERINRKFEELKQEKDKVINEVRTILDRERDRGLIAYLIRQNKISLENLEKLRNIIDNFFGHCNEFSVYLGKLIELQFYFKLLLELDNLKKKVESNLNSLNKIKNEFAKNASDIIASTDSGYEKRLFLYSEEEIEYVYNYFNTKLNLTNDFYSKMLSDPKKKIDLLKEELKSGYENEIKKHLNALGEDVQSTVRNFLFDDENKMDLISRYFDMILENVDDPAEKVKIITNTVDNWLNLGSFLGRLDKDKIGGEVGSYSHTYYIVMLPEELYESNSDLANEIKRKIKEISEKRGVELSIGKNTSKEKDSIVILGLQSLLPLFLFEEMHELKESYLEINNTIEKIARHNSKFYYYFDEPVGKNWSISNEKDFNYIMNLAYQLRAIRGDKDNFEDKLLIAKLEGNIIEYKSPKNHQNLTAFEFFENYSKYPTVIDEIEDAISTVYSYLVDKAIKLGDENETFRTLKEDYLPKFLTSEDDRFLVIPEDFIPKIKEKLSKTFFNSIGVNFIKKYRKKLINPTVLESVKKKFGEKIYSNEKELEKAGLFIIPDIITLPVVEYVLIYQYKDEESKKKYRVIAANKNTEGKKKYIFTSEERLISKIKELLDKGIDENSIYIFSTNKELNAEGFLDVFQDKTNEVIQQYTKTLKELKKLRYAVFSYGKKEKKEVIIEWE
ncbi:tubulin-like doman-containing protein [Persephonella sp.]